MTRLIKHIEELILQTHNYKEVLSYICEAEELDAIKNVIREDIQQRIAFLTELEDIYLQINVNNKAVNTYNNDNVEYWINYNTINNLKNIDLILNEIIVSNQKSLQAYTTTISALNKIHKWHYIVALQNKHINSITNTLRNKKNILVNP